eukprot:2439967-Rhodomonas_salina.1
MVIGARVVRGHDWKWEAQDGGPGGEGSIQGHIAEGSGPCGWTCGGTMARATATAWAHRSETTRLPHSETKCKSATLEAKCQSVAPETKVKSSSPRPNASL